MEEEKKENSGEPESKVEVGKPEKEAENVDARVTNKEPCESENVHDESHYEGKINLEQLIFAEFDRSLSLKERLESKVGGYMTVVTLILTILVQFAAGFYESHVCEIFKIVSLGFCVGFFFLGIILLFMCIQMLFPKKIRHFDVNELLKLKRKTPKKIDKELLDDVKRFYGQNIAVVDAKAKINGHIATGLVILVGGFVVTAILYFAMIVNNKCFAA